MSQCSVLASRSCRWSVERAGRSSTPRCASGTACVPSSGNASRTAGTPRGTVAPVHAACRKRNATACVKSVSTRGESAVESEDIEITFDTHTHLFSGPLSWTTRMSRYQKGKTSLDFTEARDSEWQWHQLGPMQVCTSLQTDNHTSTPPLSFYRPDALPAAQTTASKH